MDQERILILCGGCSAPVGSALPPAIPPALTGIMPMMLQALGIDAGAVARFDGERGAAELVGYMGEMLDLRCERCSPAAALTRGGERG